MVFHHVVQDAVARLRGAFGFAVGRGVAVGRTDDACKEGRLSQGQLAHVFAEVGLRGLAEAMNGETGAVAKVDFVGIKLEDLLLGEASLELQRHKRLGELAPQGLLSREEKAARHLHGNGAGALRDPFVPEVGQGSANDAHEINAGMLEEAFVLRREHRVHQRFGQIIEADRPALLARAVKEIGE